MSLQYELAGSSAPHTKFRFCATMMFEFKSHYGRAFSRALEPTTCVGGEISLQRPGNAQIWRAADRTEVRAGLTNPAFRVSCAVSSFGE